MASAQLCALGLTIMKILFTSKWAISVHGKDFPERASLRSVLGPKQVNKSVPGPKQGAPGVLSCLLPEAELVALFSTENWAGIPAGQEELRASPQVLLWPCPTVCAPGNLLFVLLSHRCLLEKTSQIPWTRCLFLCVLTTSA